MDGISHRYGVTQTALLAWTSGILVVLIWSGWIVISRAGLKNELTASDLTLLRFLTAAILTLPLSYKYDWRNLPWKKALVVSIGCGFPYTMLSFWGMQLNSAANASVLVNGSLPFLTAVLGALLYKSQPPRGIWWLAGLMLLANCLIMLGPNDSWTFDPVGMLFLLFAACILASYIISVKYWKITVREILIWVPSINAVLFFPAWLLLPSQMSEASFNNILWQIGYQGALVSVFALFLFSYAVKMLSTFRVSVLMAFVPASTTILGFLVLQEKPAPIQIIGVILCTLAIIISSLSTNPKDKG